MEEEGLRIMQMGVKGSRAAMRLNGAIFLSGVMFCFQSERAFK